MASAADLAPFVPFTPGTTFEKRRPSPTGPSPPRPPPTGLQSTPPPADTSGPFVPPSQASAPTVAPPHLVSDAFAQHAPASVPEMSGPPADIFDSSTDALFADDLSSDVLAPSPAYVNAPVSVQPVMKQPLDFPAVWSAIMSNPFMRMWAFTIKPPDVHELLRARENGPVEKSFILESPDDNDYLGFDEKIFDNRFHEVYGSCYRLSCGSYLGIVINSKSIDVCAAPFAVCNPIFAQGRQIVNRLIVLHLDGVLVAVEFSWLKTGALVIRFNPFNRISHGSRGDLKFGSSMYAFMPTDAQTLATCAHVGSDKNFLDGNFDNLLMEGYYSYQMFDTKYQAACMYCRIREGVNICDCPMPLRRRYADDNIQVIPYEVPEQGSAWNEFPVAKLLSSRSGSLIFNCRLRPHSPRQVVLFSGGFPFDFKIQSQLWHHPVLQRYMTFADDGAVNPVSLILNAGIVLDNNMDSAEKYLTPSPENSESSSDKRTFQLTNIDINAGEDSSRYMGGLHRFVPSNEKRLRTNNARGAALVSSVNRIEYQQPQHANYNNNNNNQYSAPINVTINNYNVVYQQPAETPAEAGLQKRKSTTITSGNAMSIHQSTGSSGSALMSRGGPSSSGAAHSSNAKGSDGSAGSSPGTSKEAAQKNDKKNKLDVKMTYIEIDGEQRKSWKCPECHMVILNKKSNLTRHIDTKHRRNTERFECSFEGCDLSFQTKHNRKRHYLHVHRNGNNNNSGNSSNNSNGKGNGGRKSSTNKKHNNNTSNGNMNEDKGSRLLVSMEPARAPPVSNPSSSDSSRV